VRRLFFAVLGFLGLAACVNYEQQEETYLSSMIGLTEDQLIERMGVPQQTYVANGHKFLAYNQTSTSYYSDPGFGFGMMGGPFDFGEPDFGGGEVDVTTCQTVFEIVNGHVQNFSRHGNGC
jgi:uncharacterized membrane protein